MIKVQGHIDETGKLNIYNMGLVNDWKMSNVGKEVSLIFKEHRRNRSNLQNGYYWKVVVPMVQQAMNEYGNDFDMDETHDFLKKEFNYVEKEVREGYYLKVPRSTTRLNTVEFNDYKEKIQQFGSQVLGIYIPDPGEVIEINF